MKKGQKEYAEAACPFYKKECRDNQQVYCEGFMNGVSITINFQDREEFFLHEAGYCYSAKNYSQCPIAEMLIREIERN